MDFDRQQHSAVKALSGPKSRQALQTSVFVSFGFDNRPLSLLLHHEAILVPVRRLHS